MDARNGRIYEGDDLVEVQKAFGQFVKPMKIPPTEVQLSRTPPRVGRNEPCPCGSGKKFKKCCKYVKSEAASG